MNQITITRPTKVIFGEEKKIETLELAKVGDEFILKRTITHQPTTQEVVNRAQAVSIAHDIIFNSFAHHSEGYTYKADSLKVLVHRHTVEWEWQGMKSSDRFRNVEEEMPEWKKRLKTKLQ